MAFDVALGVSAMVLSVVAIGLSLVFFFKTNDLFGEMNTTEARIEEIGRSTAEKMPLVVDKAVDFWTRPTKENQTRREVELTEVTKELSAVRERITNQEIGLKIENAVAKIERLRREFEENIWVRYLKEHSKPQG